MLRSMVNQAGNLLLSGHRLYVYSCIGVTWFYISGSLPPTDYQKHK